MMKTVPELAPTVSEVMSVFVASVFLVESSA